MKYTAFSEKGNRRDNADYYIADPENKIFIIADGVGAFATACEASRTACKQIHQELLKSLKEEKNKLCDSIEKATETLRREIPGQATTIDVVLMNEKRIYIGHVGDSRVYLLRNNRLIPLTDDHIEFKNMLSRAVGTNSSEPDIIITSALRPYDLFAMTTDGVHDVLTKEEFTEILSSGISLEDMADNLKKMIEFQGAPDNYTGILIRI